MRIFNAHDKRTVFTKAGVVLVSAGVAGSGSANYARAVCDCTMEDILGPTRTITLGSSSFRKSDSPGGSPMFHATVPVDNNYGFRSTAAPNLTYKIDASRLWDLEHPTYEYETDIQRWSFTGETWVNGSNASIEVVNDIVALDPPVSGLYDDSNNDKDTYFTRIFVRNGSSTIVDEMLASDIMGMDAVLRPQTQCW